MASLELQSSTFSRKLRAFLRWMRNQGIEYTDALTFELGGRRSVADIGVRSLCPLHTDDLIATIPKLACLTVRTTAAAELIEEEKIPGVLGLAVALLYEKRLEERSKWFGYLQLLPCEQSLPYLWSPMEIDSLLLGTELHEAVKEERILMEEDWKVFIAPLSLKYANECPATWFSLDQYLKAKTLVDSRAFEVDEYHGFGMVPLADLFNHRTAAEDVHFTSISCDTDSDSDANIFSGVLTQQTGVESGKQGKVTKVEENYLRHPCIAEESSQVPPSAWEGSSSLLEMILVKDVAQDSEIFNTYGTLSNAALLHRYGFTEADNPFDIVNIDFTLIFGICLESFTARHIRRRSAQWKKIGCVPCLSQDCEYFEISFLGRPQLDFLMWLFLVHMSDDCFEKFTSLKHLNDKGVFSAAKALGWKSSVNRGPVSHSKKSSWQRKTLSREDSSLIDLEGWLLSIPVGKSVLKILQKRDSLYPTASLADDFKLLSRICCKEQPKEFHAIRLRCSERSILKRCQTKILALLA